jgi:lipopolysaccharide export system protein LptA
MRNRVERLRVWLLGGAGFLAVVIAAFLGSAHYLSRHRLALPARFGVNIVSETNGYTYSQSVQGKTVFTIHAAKAVEHTDNKIVLHDVSIALYGEKQDRNDRIYGDEFEYDKKAGVVRATGLAHIDLQAADAGGGHDSAASAKVLHVTTSGLVYLEKLGVAATNEYIEFQAGAMTGHATGADYSRDSGVLTMHSAVSMSGGSGKRAMVVTAATAEFDNPHQVAFLTNARYVAQVQTVEAQRATLHRRPDGTLARVEAEGNVTIEANGGTVVSQRADVALNAKSQPESAVLSGGMHYTSGKPLLQRSGQADGATIEFDAEGVARHAEFVGAVHMFERTRASADGREPWSTRDLTAAKVEAALAPVSAGKAGNREQGAGNRASAGVAQVRDVEAIGGARLAVVNNGTLAHAHGRATTELSADDLKAHLIAAKDASVPPWLDTVTGRGNTILHQVTAKGVDQTISGELLDAKFRGEGSGRASSANGNAKQSEDLDDVQSAVQLGHVTMTRRAPAKSRERLGGATGASALGQQEVEHATAQRVAYDGDLDRVTLSGGVQMSDRTSVLWADQVLMYRTSGDAHASGSVKVSYLAQEGGNQLSGLRGTAPGATAPASTLQPATPVEPTHVVAASADLVRGTGVATFYGKPARLWQAGSQVQAPVIQLQLVEQSGTWELSKLIAHGDATGPAGQVRTILVHTAKPRSAKTGKPLSCSTKSESTKPSAEKSQRLPSVVRITSGQFIYSGDLRQAEFTGGVRAETLDGTIRAAQATAFLQPEAKGTAASAQASPQFAVKVERMIATGQIQIDQPGLRATGGRLVYTAADGLFVLTGDGKSPPKLVDSECGTITGAVLQFHTGDNSVVVSNGKPEAMAAAAGQRVRAETPAGKDATMGKGK